MNNWRFGGEYKSTREGIDTRTKDLIGAVAVTTTESGLPAVKQGMPRRMSSAVGLEQGLEVPTADAFGGSASVKMTIVKPPSVPNLGLKKAKVTTDEDWWQQNKNRSSALSNVLRFFGKNDAVSMDPVVLEGLRMFMEEEEQVDTEPKILVWSPKAKEKKSKKSVTWLVDVPYKHTESGEVFEGPVSSQLTYQKEKGEDKVVFVNPEV